MSKPELGIYEEAFNHHCDRCDSCSLITRDLCTTGRRLYEAYAMRAASLMVPIHVLEKPGAKA